EDFRRSCRPRAAHIRPVRIGIVVSVDGLAHDHCFYLRHLLRLSAGGPDLRHAEAPSTLARDLHCRSLRCFVPAHWSVAGSGCASGDAGYRDLRAPIAIIDGKPEVRPDRLPGWRTAGVERGNSAAAAEFYRLPSR